MKTGFEKLDGRNLNYRFDSEKDIPWEQAEAPGLYFNRLYLEKLGFNVNGLLEVPEAHDFFQKSLALCTCETFASLEEDVILFLREEREDANITASSLLLVEEEVKHSIVFRRFGRILCGILPRIEPLFERYYAPPPGFTNLKGNREKLGKPAVLHYLFWLNTVFFEEFTLYLYDLLAEDRDEINPAWLTVHKVHKDEEIQHVVTDMAYIEQSPLTTAERYQWSKVFYFYVEENFLQYFCLDAVAKAMKEEYPEIELFTATPKLSSLPFFEDFIDGRAFRRTRTAAPYLQRFQEERKAGTPSSAK